LIIGPFGTFSIAAYDPENGDLGVAVASRYLAVGSVVPWAKAGVGAVATQSWCNTLYGVKGLKMLEEGMSPQDVLEKLTKIDESHETRQVGIVDTTGTSASYTGAEAQAWAGHRFAQNYAIQGNILVGKEVVLDMERAFLKAEGSLPERLMASLEAGDAAGGDSRGKQSAAILVVRDMGSDYSDRYIDFRVDDHSEPIAELRRIYELRYGK
jgi:uncharacterized Ntn-hydrolase superfamily protein